MDPLIRPPVMQEPFSPVALDNPSTAIGCSDRYFGYRKLLDDISQKLLKENALRLASLYELPSWYFEIGPSHDPSYALRVMIALEGKGVYSPSSCAGLTAALKHIEREDLCSIVKEFIREKAELGLVQERIRRQTHPQPSPYVHKRGGQFNSSFNHYQHLNTDHSTSLSSLIAGNCVEEEGIQRSRSRPLLHDFSGGDGTIETDSARPSLSTPQPLLLAERNGSALGLQLVLISAQSLRKQLKILAKECPISESSPIKPREADFILNAVTATESLIKNLNQALRTGSPTSSRRFSQSGSFIEMSRMSSRCSDRMDTKRADGSFQTEAASLFDSGHHKSRNTTKVTAPPPPEAIHPLPLTSSSTTPITSYASSQPPSVPVVTVHRAISRRRSRKEEKKMNKRGILMWHVKVKKLRQCITQREAKIESDDFYDCTKRSMRAILCPYGLGDDGGSHMTLLIHCLDEPKSGAVSNVEIVVNILDPQSDSPTQIKPIKRSLERRGIRVVQQFLAHSQIDHFKSNYVTITVAVLGKQMEESDGSDNETQESAPI